MSTTTLPEPVVLEPTALDQRSPVEPAKPIAGTVYTETVIFSAPEAFVRDAPYQIAIIDLDEGDRLTSRITGENVDIGDRVELVDYRQGVPFFQKPV